LPLSRAAVAVGADGLLIEVHHEPDKALSDGMQSLLPEEFIALADEMRQIAAVLHRTIQLGDLARSSRSVKCLLPESKWSHSAIFT